MKKRSGVSIGRLLLVLPLSAVIAASVAPAPAHAGLYDRVKDIFELPGEVDRLKEDYRQVKDNYEETVRQLDETRRQAEEYRKLQEQLMADNVKLMEENRQLSETVEELKASEEGRNRMNNRWQKLLWTAVLLVAGYFIVTRVARYVMRARGR